MENKQRYQLELRSFFYRILLQSICVILDLDLQKGVHSCVPNKHGEPKFGGNLGPTLIWVASLLFIYVILNLLYYKLCTYDPWRNSQI